MNPIELEYLKKDQLSGQMFDDELDLAYAVMNGVKARGERSNPVQNVLNLTIIAELKFPHSR